MEHKTIGIIGGGQLGKMLIQAGINYPVDFYVYSNAEEFPSKSICQNYTVGSYNNYQKIVDFGKKCDIITIEIENINIEALEYLYLVLNKKVYPQPNILECIKDRTVQKDFLTNLDPKIKTMNYVNYSNVFDVEKLLKKNNISLPFVNKVSIGGYDGYGTKIIKDENYLSELFPTDSIIEEFCQIDRELAVIVGRNSNGEIVIYPPVEMQFNEQNMLDHLLCPARDVNLKEINYIAEKIARKFNLVGIMAIELFESNGELYVNELAPRPHNSGHHTQDMFNFSQFDILIRCLLDLPLPNLNSLYKYSACLNILGNKNATGSVIYHKLNKLGDTHLHLYGKKTTKPYRKMGHLNIVSNEYDDLILKLVNARNILEGCVSSNNKEQINLPKVGIIMGSSSDLSIMEGAINVLKDFDIPHEVSVVSAHRTPEMMLEYGKTAQEKGLEIIIAGAGGAAHLPGMIASCTSLPVIGVPIKSSNSIDGWDSILSILQMPNGVPVATVALNGAQNAGLLAVRMLGYQNEMDEYREGLKRRVEEMNKLF
jgi:phosphoribosylaminoimidazole carboxylase